MSEQREPSEWTVTERPSESDVSEKSQRRERLATALASAGFEDALVVTREDARRILDGNRGTVLDRLRDDEVESVSHLAELLDRDVGNVSRDLQVLADHGVVNLAARGRKKVPELAHEHVVVEPLY